MMQFDVFRRVVEMDGLQARKCSPHHWQIIGGSAYRVVNVWPNSKRGFIYQVKNDKGRKGTLHDAIELAGACVQITPPWENEPQLHKPEQVGLIRWLWRWIW